MSVMKKWLSIVAATVLCVFGSAPAFATDLSIRVQIPRIDVAEYHRPYVAVWIENPDQSVAAHLAVWYQTDPRKEDGTQWLKDLRQWWRRGGRELAVPIDGVTGATRPVGEQRIVVKGKDAALSKLAPGKYGLVVEAVREVGGREVVKIPFEWPAARQQPSSTQGPFSEQGKVELGAVSLEFIP